MSKNCKISKKLQIYGTFKPKFMAFYHDFTNSHIFLLTFASLTDSYIFSTNFNKFLQNLWPYICDFTSLQL
jgi:hypothetical protein